MLSYSHELNNKSLNIKSLNIKIMRMRFLNRPILTNRTG